MGLEFSRRPEGFNQKTVNEAFVPATRLGDSFQANGLDFTVRLIDYGDIGDPNFEVKFDLSAISNQRLRVLIPNEKPMKHKEILESMTEGRNLILGPKDRLEIKSGGKFGFGSAKTVVTFLDYPQEAL